MLISADRVITATSDLRPGWVQTSGETITAVGEGSPKCPADIHVPLLVPGLVDTHAHGGGGGDFGNLSDIDTVLAAHRADGTTTMVASLVTTELVALRDYLAQLASRVEAGDLAGIHLEGPWLAEAYKGAHAAALLRDPHPTEVREVLEAARGTVKMVTIAAEKPGACQAIAVMRQLGAVAAIGHGDMSYDDALAAIAAGARGVTHLFNAMPGLGHRAPGPILAAVRDERVFLELIFDGVHVHRDLAASVLTKYPHRSVLITDAMAAAAGCDGHYNLGELDVDVVDGVAMLSGTTTIAGSTLTLIKAIRHAHAAGVPLEIAVRAATINPARYLGLAGVGDLAVGMRADLLLLSQTLDVHGVVARGQLTPPAQKC